jgi:hypothetical protein
MLPCERPQPCPVQEKRLFLPNGPEFSLLLNEGKIFLERKRERETEREKERKKELLDCAVPHTIEGRA